RHREADLWRRGAARGAERSAPGTLREDPAVSAQTTTARADDDEAVGHRHRHTGVGSGMQEAYRRAANGRALSAPGLQSPARAVPGKSWRRELVRDVVQPATGLPLRQHE